MNMKKIALAVMLVLGSTALYADNFMEVGAGVNIYSSLADYTDLDTALAVDVRWGTLANTGLYAWGSYEQPEVTFNNLNLGKIRMFGLGGGLRVPMGERFYGYAEAGYYMPSEESQLEPLTFSNEFGGSFGVGFDISDHITMDAGYKYLKVDKTSPWDVQEVDMSSWSLGASYRF